jgi:RimJ/RimL family protein N-acetyltransferase
MRVQAVTLTGRTVRVEPLAVRHAEDLRQAADPRIFAYLGVVPDEWTAGEFVEYLERTLAQPDRIPFAIVRQDTGQAVGTTSYMDIRPEHRGLEIGHTWIGRDYQGTAINPENKYLLLRHAFEELGAVRVQLKTDKRNEQSQRAIAKLGARYEGTLRKHMVLPDGYVRDTVMFSIVEEEWPAVKASLEQRLGYVP